MRGEVVYGSLVEATGRLQRSWFGFGEFGQAGAQQPVVGAGQEECVVESGVGDVVAVAVRESGDQCVGPESS